MKYPLFGTDGIRCTVGQSPLTIHELPLLAYAIAQWIIETYGKNVHVLLANDSRLSSSFIKASLETGLLLHPLCIYDAGILPTPAVCQLVKHDNHFQAGIMITASHNPYQDNGIKLINHLGEKISNNEELIIEEYTKNVKEIKYTNHS